MRLVSVGVLWHVVLAFRFALFFTTKFWHCSRAYHHNCQYTLLLPTRTVKAMSESTYTKRMSFPVHNKNIQGGLCATVPIDMILQQGKWAFLHISAKYMISDTRNPVVSAWVLELIASTKSPFSSHYHICDLTFHSTGHLCEGLMSCCHVACLGSVLSLLLCLPIHLSPFYIYTPSTIFNGISYSNFAWRVSVHNSSTQLFKNKKWLFQILCINFAYFGWLRSFSHSSNGF